MTADSKPGKEGMLPFWTVFASITLALFAIGFRDWVPLFVAFLLSVGAIVQLYFEWAKPEPKSSQLTAKELFALLLVLLAFVLAMSELPFFQRETGRILEPDFRTFIQVLVFQRHIPANQPETIMSGFWHMLFWPTLLSTVLVGCHAHRSTLSVHWNNMRKELFSEPPATNEEELATLDHARKVAQLKVEIAKIGQSPGERASTASTPIAPEPSDADKMLKAGEDYKKRLEAIANADFLSEKDKEGLKKEVERQMKAEISTIITAGRK